MAAESSRRWPSAYGPMPPCYGIFSCLFSSCDEEYHAASSSQDTKKIIYNCILGFYEQACNRLPLEDMPALVDLIDTGGLCLGLLDPVSNIIINTLSLLPPKFSSDSLRPTPRQSSSPFFSAGKRTKSSFYEIASKSYLGLLGFMLDYFGYLTEGQANRYLRWAKADITLAVLLAEYDLNFHERHLEFTDHETRLPHPWSQRTQASLEIAVRRVGHPAPDRLVRLFTASVIPPQRLKLIKSVLLVGDTKLTIENVWLLQHLLQESATSNPHVTLMPHGGVVTRVPDPDDFEISSHIGDGYNTTTIKPVGGYISSLRSHQDMDFLHSWCLQEAYSLEGRLKKDCGESCEHLKSLKMCLRGTIHSLYLKAITLLPSEGANMLIRDILVAGHCYGPFEPVTNIIINSIWHNKFCPLPVADSIERYDIIDTLSILRTEVRSLEGMMELVHTKFPEFSTKDGVNFLWRKQCDMSTSFFEEEFDLFFRAAVAAQHPQPAALVLFHRLLLMKKYTHTLHSLLGWSFSRRLSLDNISYLADLVSQVFKVTPEVQRTLQPQVPQLHKDAYSTLLKKRSEYQSRGKYIRSKVEQLLDKYAAQHPWEEKYMLHVICGVEKCGYLFTEGYRVNFISTSESRETKLFFAEFWVACKPGESKPDICSPLNPPYAGGRCFYAKTSARKILYPDSAEYFTCDVTAHGIGNVDDIIDTDFVYYNSEKDAEFAKKVNSYYAENSFWRPTVLNADTNTFAGINFDTYQPSSPAPKVGIGLSLGEP